MQRTYRDYRILGAGLLLWGVIIATPFVAFLGSSASKKIILYWEYIAIIFSISIATWVFIWAAGRYSCRQNKRKRLRAEGPNHPIKLTRPPVCDCADTRSPLADNVVRI